MQGHEITCIRKNDSYTDCRCITNVKTNLDEDLTVSEVINMIRGNFDGTNHRFYVVDPKDESEVDVRAVPQNNPWYIRTQANDTEDDNLLELDIC